MCSEGRNEREREERERERIFCFIRVAEVL